jgi:regulator of protease activity HflC (stomatin/prohibitin superfamily)
MNSQISTLFLCFFGFVFLMGVLLIAMAVRIVPEYQRAVVFRLGRCIGYKGPGLVLLIPFLDRGVKVDLREQVREVKGQIVTTRDKVQLAMDFNWYYKVTDPVANVLQVSNFEIAAQDLASATSRAVIAETLRNEALVERETISRDICKRMSSQVKQWGADVTRVEIRVVHEV